MRDWQLGGICIAFAIAAPSFANSPDHLAPDSSLQNESSIVERATLTDTIRGGARRGQNLFHSFQDFNVEPGRSVYFINPSNQIQNILTRVTGQSPSNILGTLGIRNAAGVNSSPNLFLINPQGIVFGDRTRLVLRGSFIASTANALEFENQEFFSATNPVRPTLLTVNPSALWFNQKSVAPILTRSGSLRGSLSVPPDQSLLLVGGEIVLNQLQANVPGGRIELAGLAENGKVDLVRQDDRLGLKLPDNLARANIQLTNGVAFNVAASRGGDIRLHGQTIELSSSSSLRAGIEQGQLSNAPRSGDIEVNATGDVNLNSSLILNSVSLPASAFVSQTAKNSTLGQGGDIRIRARSLTLEKGAIVTTSTFSQASAGNIFLDIDEDVSISGVPTQFRVELAGINSTQLNTSKLLPGELSRPSGLTFTSKVSLNNLLLSAFTGIASNTQTNSLLNPKARTTNNISDNSIAPISAGIFSTVELGAKGDAGNIRIYARSISVTDGAQIQTLTDGNGRAGNILVKATDRVLLSGSAPIQRSFGGFSSGLLSSSEENATGTGGQIEVKTRVLDIGDRAVISSRSQSNANGGRIDIGAETVTLNGGGQILATAFKQGQAGEIQLTTNGLFISGVDPTFASRFQQVQPKSTIDNDGASSGILTRSQATGNSPGNAGQITIQAQQVKLDDQGTVAAATRSSNGGNVFISAQSLLQLRRNSIITTTAGTDQAGGNGGKIQISTPFIVTIPTENSDISANAFSGKGGSVVINSQGIFGIQPRSQVTNFSDITASSTFGESGTISINSPEVDPSRGLSPLPTDTADPTQQINQNCSPEAQAKNSLTNIGRGGIAQTPDDRLSSEELRPNWVEVPTRSENQSAQVFAKVPKPTVEARFWRFDTNGDVLLIAASESDQTTFETVRSCP